MGLTKFGKAAVRLESVLAIREVPPPEGGKKGAGEVEVFFAPSTPVVFSGDDAAAIRKMVEALPDGLAERPKAIGWSVGSPDAPPAQGVG